ncbi:MAG: hypothetical protein KAT65_08595, partial [Methanophagales archaeon]|nr:hypothetical protein [Methanophagales archaeon]
MKKENDLFKVYENIKSILKDENISVSEYKLIDYGLQFTVSTLNWSGVIRIYQNKKGGLKIDYSQLKGGANATKIQTLIEGKRIPSASKNSSKKDVE